MDEKYNSRLGFGYNCIMSILKKEYPKLKMDKLEAGVNKYMKEQNQRDKGQEGTLPVPEEQHREVEDEVLNTGVEEVLSPTEVTSPVFATIVDPSKPVEPPPYDLWVLLRV